MPFDDAICQAVLAHMNDDHAADSLLIVQAHGHPAATGAEMTGVDEHGGTWHVTEGTAEATLRVAWTDAPVTERAGLRTAVVELHERAVARLEEHR